VKAIPEGPLVSHPEMVRRSDELARCLVRVGRHPARPVDFSGVGSS
jgi:hypothetical protein